MSTFATLIERQNDLFGRIARALENTKNRQTKSIDVGLTDSIPREELGKISEQP